MNYNKIILMGNLTKEPELRFTPTGIKMCKLRLGVNRKYTTKAGDKKEETLFIGVAVWEKQAEMCVERLRKGEPVFVEGRLQMQNYEKDGEKHITYEIRADRVLLLNSKKETISEGSFEPLPEGLPPEA